MSHHYGFTNCFEISNFVFSNVIPGGISICKVLTFQDWYSHKYKAQKIVKFSFVVFLDDFFFNFALKTYGTLKMFVLCAYNNFYIILSSYLKEHVQKNSSLNFMPPVGFQASEIWMFFWKFTAELVWKSFSGRNNSLEPPVFWFSNSLPYV